MGRDNLLAFGWTAAASALVGLLVGATAILVQLYQPVMLSILAASALAGVIIGVVIRGVCLLLIKHSYCRPLLVWALILGLIGLGTVAAAECIGRLPPIGRLPLREVAILVAVAELFGLAVAYANYRHAKFINGKLQQKIEQLREGTLRDDNV